MSFAHKDFYHSPSTLTRVAAHLKTEGYINDKEKKYIDECIYMSDSVRGTVAGESKNIEETKELRKLKFNEKSRSDKLKSTIDDLGQSVKLTPKKDKFGTYDNYKFTKIRTKASEVVDALGKYVAANTKNQKLEFISDVVAAVHGGIAPSGRVASPSKQGQSPRRSAADPSKCVIYFSNLRDSDREIPQLLGRE